METVLITGGAGFIGSNLAESLLDKDYFVIVVDNLQTGFFKNIEHLDKLKNFAFIKVDVNKYEEILPVFSNNKINFVFHYAATVGVQRTLANPLMVLGDIEGIKNILLLSKLNGVKRVFYSSSSEVYGEPVEHPQNEDKTPLNSKLPYAIVKNLGEAYLKAYQKECGLAFTIFRIFNTYGPRQSIDFVLTKFIKQALNDEPITINGDGKQTRTFCYVSDSVETAICALNSNEAVNQIINIGSDYEISIKELAKMVIKLTGSKSKIKHLPPLEEGDMRQRRPDIAKMKRILKIDRMVSLKDGIKETIEWYRKCQRDRS